MKNKETGGLLTLSQKQEREREKNEREEQIFSHSHSLFHIFKEACTLPLAAEISPITISQAIIPYKFQNNTNKQNMYYQSEQENLFYGLSAGTINEFDLFNIRQQQEESDDAKVMNRLF